MFTKILSFSLRALIISLFVALASSTGFAQNEDIMQSGQLKVWRNQNGEVVVGYAYRHGSHYGGRINYNTFNLSTSEHKPFYNGVWQSAGRIGYDISLSDYYFKSPDYNYPILLSLYQSESGGSITCINRGPGYQFSSSLDFCEKICYSEKNKNYFAISISNYPLAQLYFTTDGGVTFNSDATSRDFYIEAMHPYRDSIMYNLGINTLIVSTDTGKTKSVVSSIPSLGKSELAFDKDENTIYLYSLQDIAGVYRSSNLGKNWSKIPNINSLSAFVAGYKSGQFFIVSGGNLVEYSNYGDSQEMVGSIPGSISAIATAPNIDSLFLIVDHKVYAYSNGISLPITPTAIDEVRKEDYILALTQNYPNPASTTTTISYELPEQSKVTLKIYNLLGEEVKTILDCSQQPQGKYQEEVNVAKLPNGVYIYVLEVNGKRESKKMLIVK